MLSSGITKKGRGGVGGHCVSPTLLDISYDVMLEHIFVHFKLMKIVGIFSLINKEMHKYIHEYDGTWNVLIRREFNPESVKVLDFMIKLMPTKKDAFRLLYHAHHMLVSLSIDEGEESDDESDNDDVKYVLLKTNDLDLEFLLFRGNGCLNAETIRALEMLRMRYYNEFEMYISFYLHTKKGFHYFSKNPRNGKSNAYYKSENDRFKRICKGCVEIVNHVVRPTDIWQTLIIDSKTKNIVYKKKEIVSSKTNEEVALCAFDTWQIIDSKDNIKIMDKHGLLVDGHLIHGGRVQYQNVYANGRKVPFDRNLTEHLEIVSNRHYYGSLESKLR